MSVSHGVPRPRRGGVAAALARSRLGVPQVVFFVLAAAAPMTVVASAVPTAYAVTGLSGVPVAYAATAAVMLLFAVGYVAMSRHVVNAGSMYSYVAHALGPASGVAAAFVAVVAYNLMQIGLYGAFGVVAAAAASAVAGVSVPWWVWAFAGWALVAGLGLARVDLNGRVLGVLLVAEIAVVVVFDTIMVTADPAGGVLSLHGLEPAHLAAPGMAAILVGGIAGYVGVEATTVLAEETRDPQRTVAYATYTAIAVTAVLYAGSAWAMQTAAGPDHIVGAAARHGPELMFVLIDGHLPRLVVDLGRLLLLTSLFAALLAFHNMVARYLFALGREQVLPAALGRTNGRTGAPKLGSLTQTAAAGTVITIYAAAGLDPITHLFFWLTVTGGLGVLILMTATSLAVIAYFRHDRRGESRWSVTVAPAGALAVLTVVLAGTLIGFGDLLNVPAGSPARWLLPGLYGVAITAGLGWAAVLHRTRPSAYDSVGAGADAVTRPTTHTSAPIRQETRR
ncbi:amino acid/polyamine/organocation transporter (APC superfamily) [Micromonospora sp. Llam0]|uniref:APC family permease n=1 Tax=Micromonospora sp. Llam0 TaxID=2485143 RepID=UPI000FB2463B|nr:APC family permease [Micromonospora sp. Llam0]ROO52688.1 amino acid/polyamine/organocation transporter (APC superfamily) [Micromonospora sp. Llam0]